MKVSIQKLYNASVKNETGTSALKALMNTKLPALKALSLYRAVNKCREEVMNFEQVQNEIIKNLGEEIIENESKTGRFKVKDENITIFQEEIKKLLDVEVDIDFPEINISDIKDQNIEAVNLSCLDFIVKD